MDDLEGEDCEADMPRRPRRVARGARRWSPWLAGGGAVMLAGGTAWLAWGSRLAPPAMPAQAWAAVALAITLLSYALGVSTRLRSRPSNRHAADGDAARRDHDTAHRKALSFDHAGVGAALIDDEHDIVDANRALAAMVGEEAPALVGRSMLDLLKPGDADTFVERAQKVRASGDATDVELRLLAMSGPARWAWVRIAPLPSSTGERAMLLVQVADVTQRRQAQRVLRRAAYRDALTGLPNAHAFTSRLADLSARAAAGDERFAVLCLEVDIFRRVNASLGRATAHAMLRAVGQRIASSLRAADTVARIGDDAFAVCAPGVAGPDAAMALAQLLRTSLERPVRAGEIELAVGVSIGVTIGGGDGRAPDALIRDADLAAHAARSDGQGHARFYSEGMHERLRQRVELETDLLRALADDGLHLDFQPLVDLSTMTPCGLEALLRWTHPRLGPISPGVFVPLAEETDQITAVTDYVLERAVAQLGAWQRESLLWPGFRLHVNVSGKDLARERLPANLARLLQLHGVAGSLLSLEITETALMQRIREVDTTLRALQAMGVGLDIDDFGTGYSSLAYLGSVPFDTLKIDRSFVSELTRGPEAVEIVRTIVSLAHNLKRRTLAEGIETETQRDLLRELGVDAAQGYLFATPMGEQAARALLASQAAAYLGMPGAPAAATAIVASHEVGDRDRH